jgi:hypothetical protein
VIEFFNTQMGRMFYEGTAPRIAKALERIATALEQKNKKETGKMRAESAYTLVSSSIERLKKALKPLGLESKLLNVVDNPNEYPKALTHADARAEIGYIQGFADGADMTVREMLDLIGVEASEE